MTGAGGYQHDATFGFVERNTRKRGETREEKEKEDVDNQEKKKFRFIPPDKTKGNQTELKQKSRVLSKSWATYM